MKPNENNITVPLGSNRIVPHIFQTTIKPYQLIYHSLKYFIYRGLKTLKATNEMSNLK